MKKYISSAVLILIFIGIMNVSVMARPPVSYNDQSPRGLVINIGNRAAQHTNANMGLDFRPNNTNWTNVHGGNTGNSVINVPRNVTFVNFLYWDFGTHNGQSGINQGWLFGGTKTVRVNGSPVNLGVGQHESFNSYTPPHMRAIRARGMFVAINANHFQRINSDTVTIDLIRWHTVRGQLVDVRSSITFIINWTGEELPPPPPPANIIYNDLTQLMRGVTSAMEYSVLTTSWSAWRTGTGQPIDMSSYLCTTRPTNVAVRFRNPVSAQVGIQIPALAPPPTQLSIIWHMGDMLLGGFRPGHSYYISRHRDFADNNLIDILDGAWTNQFTHFLLSGRINPGDTIYVRSAPSAAAFLSDFARLVAPTAPAPNTVYDTPTHSLVFPTTGAFWIRTVPGTGEWIPLNIPFANAALNMYEVLSTEHETQIHVTANWAYPAFQTIVVPALEPAPDMWFEWIGDMGLGLWGFEIGHVYDISFVPSFNPLLTWFVADFPGELIPWLQPGETIYVRSARDMNSAPSAFIALTAPPLPHDIVTTAIGLEFDDGVFTYDGIEIYDRFKTGGNRQLFVVLRKQDVNGNVTTSSTHPITVGDYGAVLPLSAIGAQFRSFAVNERLEILVYSDSAAQNELSRQVIRPAVFSFE